MADNKIHFRIGSTFEGEGYKAATQAIQDNRKELNAAKNGLGELKKAFGEISPGAAAAVSGVTAFTQAFVSGGIVGGVIQLAIKGIAEAVSYCAEKVKAAEEATVKWAQALRDKTLGAITDANDKFKEMSSEIALANRQAQDLVNVLNSGEAREASNKIFEINRDRNQKLLDAMSEEAENFINVNADFEIQMVKLNEKVADAQNSMDAANVVRDNAAEVTRAASERLASVSESHAQMMEQCSEYLNARKAAENYLVNQEMLFAEGHITLQEMIAARKETALRQQEIDAQYAQQVEMLNASSANLTAARDAHTLSQIAEQEATDRATIAKDKWIITINDRATGEAEWMAKRQEAETALSDAELERADDLYMAKMELDAQVEKEKELAAKTQELADARAKAAESVSGTGEDAAALGNASGGNVTNVKVTNARDIGSSFSVGMDLSGLRADINKPDKLDSETYERIKNGTASVADWQRFDRFTEREDRDSQSSMHRIGADATRFISKADKADSWLSSRDQKFMDDFKSRVAPQLSSKLAQELMGSSGEKLLSTEKMKNILKDNSVIQAWFGKLGLK